jgi:transcriptional regulator with XRE-family HTH domain
MKIVSNSAFYDTLNVCYNSRTQRKCANAVTKYESFGSRLEQLRIRAGIETQADLARRLGVKQQTVSRWELGASRPREKDLAAIGKRLAVDVDELRRAAGYGVPAQVTLSFDQPFPLASLLPESFERFCADFLVSLYPQARTQTHLAGGSGHTQLGIDIEVTFPNHQVHTFQCKREQEFGPEKVKRAIKAHTRISDHKVILLSRVASPQARAALRNLSDWDIWDQEDISRHVRSLPKTEQLALVDVYFPGQRLALLGETEAGPWQSTKRFFAPHMVEGRIFNHRWALVGRQASVSEVGSALADPEVVAIAITAKAGGGKSRVLRDVLESFERAQPGVLTRVLSTTEPVTEKSLDQLGHGQKLLVVDDAHDRDDLQLLLRYIANPDNHARLILCFRPYAAEYIVREIAGVGVTGRLVRKIELPTPTRADARQLAEQVLASLGASLEAAPLIADYAYDSPLAVVIGAQIVAKDRVHPELFRSHAEFQSAVLQRYEKLIWQDIAKGEDQDRIRKILRVLALIQPVVPDERPTLDLIKGIESIGPAETSRLVKRLIEAGVLFKRGIKYRLSPDLLADSIIESHCITSAGQSNGYAERVFDSAIPEHMEHVLLNLGRLDWRRNEGDTSNSPLLDDLWKRLRWQDRYDNPHTKAAATVAYYQPQRALGFAARLVAEGHGDDDDVCRIIRNTAFNIEHVPEACQLLWLAGKNDRRTTNQHPQHPIRVLTELATPEPGKPRRVVEAVVDFALSLFHEDDAWRGVATPTNILVGALATEGHITSSESRRAITFRGFAVAPDEMKPVRARIVQALLSLLSHSDPYRAYRAAAALHEALRGPHGQFGAGVARELLHAWDTEFAETLFQIEQIASSSQILATVRVGIAGSVSWHAYYGPVAHRAVANRIIAATDRDLRSRTVRALVDGWGHRTREIAESGNLGEGALARVATELIVAYPSADALCAMLDDCLAEAQQCLGSGPEDAFLLFNHLLEASESLTKEIISRRLAGDESAIAGFAGRALGLLFMRSPSDAHRTVEEVLARGDSALLTVVAEGYGHYQPGSGYSKLDQQAFQMIVTSQHEIVHRYAGFLGRQVTHNDPNLAIELLAQADLVRMPRFEHEVLFWLLNDKGSPFGKYTERQITSILGALAHLPKIDDYHVVEFLKQAAERFPGRIVEFAQRRLARAVELRDWSFQALEPGYEHRSTLGLLNALSGIDYFRSMLNTALESIDDQFYEHHLGDVVVALFGPVDESFLTSLESWLEPATLQHFQVAAAVLREAGRDTMLARPEFTDRLLKSSHRAGEEAFETIRSALFNAMLSGGGSTSPGEPFPHDLAIKAFAENALAGRSRASPSYPFYEGLLRHANAMIERQLAEKKLMDEEEEANR